MNYSSPGSIAAREKPIAGVEGDLIAAEARNGVLPADKVHYVEDLDNAFPPWWPRGSAPGTWS